MLGLRGRDCDPKETGRVGAEWVWGVLGWLWSRGGEAGVWLLSWAGMGPLLADQMGCLGAPRVGVPVSSLCSRGGPCENMSPPRGMRHLSPRGNGVLINRGTNEQQGEETQRGGGGGSIDPSHRTSS